MGRQLLALLLATLGTSADFAHAQSPTRWVYAGTTVFLTANAGGGPAAIQWLHNGNPLSGATSSILELRYIQPAQAGQYTAVVSNTYGTSTIEVANIRV